MKPAKGNIRGTFFTNKPLELDYEKAMIIAKRLSEYKLFPTPVTGTSFMLSPNGLIPTSINSFEFRNRENKLNISIGPDRVDINSYMDNSSPHEALSQVSNITLETKEAFETCTDFKIVRVALASTWILSEQNLDSLQSKFLDDTQCENAFEWEIRLVRRSQPEIVGVKINNGHKIARMQTKLPIEPVLKDRIFIETDINTVPVQPDVLDANKIKAFFFEASKTSVVIIDSLFDQANND